VKQIKILLTNKDHHTMSNIKFSQLPNLANITAATIVPVVDAGSNYTVTTANLQAFVNGGNGNITTNNLSATGNITGGNILTTGNITANYFFGNGSQLTGLPETYNNANVVSLLAAFGSNTLSTTGTVTSGNVTAPFFLGNGSQLTGVVSSYGNANVATLLSSFGSNAVSTTGNVTAGNIEVTGANAQLRMAGTTSNKVNFGTTGAGSPTVGTYSPGAKVVIYDNISNTSAGYAIGVDPSTMWFGVDQAGSNFEYFVGNAKVASIETNGTIIGANLTTTGTVSATGNITGSFFLGNGSALTGVATTNNVVDLTTNQTVAGNKSFTGTTTLNPYIETVAASVNTGSSVTPTMSNGPVQRFIANSNFTLQAPSGMVTGQSITLIIRQDGTGSRLMTANAAYRWAYGVKTLSTAANSIDMLSIFYDGTNYLCNLVKGYTA